MKPIDTEGQIELAHCCSPKMPLLYRPAYVLFNTPKLQNECTAGVKEISRFLQHNPATLSDYSVKERINLVKAKVFNERKQRHERQEKRLRKLTKY